jgi:aspartyl protease family protein
MIKIYLALLFFLTFPAHAVDNVRVAGLFAGKAFLDVDGQQYVLSAGQSSPEGVKLVSATAHEAIIEIEGKRRTLTLGQYKSSGDSSLNETNTVNIWSDEGGMYRTVGSINHFPVNFLVDTGASHVVMNDAEARRLGIDYRVVGEPVSVNTASGTVPAFMVKLDKVRIGDIQFKHVKGSVIEGEQPSEVLLGMSFLGKLDMQRKGSQMSLKQKIR